MSSANGSNPNPSLEPATPGDDHKPRICDLGDHHKPRISDLASPHLFPASSCSVSSDVSAKGVHWKRDQLSELREKCELLEEANRYTELSKQQMEENKEKMHIKCYNMSVEMEKLLDKVKEMQKREWKADERNRKLVAESCEARKEEKKKLEKVLAEKRDLTVQCKNLTEELNSVGMKLEEVKLSDKEKMKLSKTIEDLKGDIVNEKNEKEILLGKIKNLEVESNRAIEVLTVQCRKLREELDAVERELEEVKLRDKEKIVELMKTIEELKGDIVNEKNEKELFLKNLEEESNRAIEGLKADIEIRKRDYAILMKDNEILKEENKNLKLGNKLSKLQSKPNIESAASMSHGKVNLEADVVLLSDDDDDDKRPLSEALNLKRPLSDMLSGGGILSTPRQKPEKSISAAATPQSKMHKLDSPSSFSYAKVKLEAEFREPDVGSDPLCTQAAMNILVSCQKSRELKLWAFDTDLVCALDSDDELCLKAICALYRQHKLAAATRIGHQTCGFKPEYASRGVALAEYLIKGDPEGRMTRSMAEYECYHRAGIDQCRFIAKQHKKELFRIYKNSLDQYFP